MGIQTSAINIILPAHNEAAGATMTLPHLPHLPQSYPNAELIVIGNGSRDAVEARRPMAPSHS